MTISPVKPSVTLIISLAFLSLASCTKKGKPGGYQGQGQNPVSVTPYIVNEQSVAYYDVYPATVTALQQVELRSEVSGFITGIYFKEGSYVESGSRLYEIDRSKYQAVYEQASAGVAIANANLQKAQRDLDRYTSLNQQNAIAKQTFDDARTTLDNAKTQVKAAKAELDNAQTDLGHSIITAPFSGTIGFSQVKKGTYVVAGQTLMNTISSNNPTGVDFAIDSKELPYYRDIERQGKGQVDSTFLLMLPDGSRYASPGRLSVIARAADPQTGTIMVRVIFPNEDGKLKTGMNIRARVLNKESGRQVVIPFKAVTEQMSEYFVFQVHGNKVKQTRIESGLNLGEYIVVLSGVQPGDTIVAEGIRNIRNGSSVKLTKPGEKAGKERVTD